MTTTSLMRRRHSIATLFLTASFIIVFFSSCRKEDKNNYPQELATYAPDVLDKWMTLQLRPDAQCYRYP
jgi:hypothetical protein